MPTSPYRFSRRSWFQATFSAGLLASGCSVGPDELDEGAESAAESILKPLALQPGDRVRVVSPAGVPSREKVERGIEILTQLGLEIELAPHVFDREGYLAGKDAHRLADLNDALRDPGIKGIFAARGGYGTQRIIDDVDVRPLIAHPKVLVGFSDITSLLAKAWIEARLPGLYGPMVSWDDTRTGEASIESLRKAIMTTDPVVIHRDPNEVTAPVMTEGRAEGILLGGNLSLVCAAIAARDFPSLDGAILFFEDVGEAPYRYDGMLTHLRRVGALSKLRGVVIGQCTDADTSPDGWDIATVLRDRLCDLGIPVLGGMPLGHGPGQLTVPLGVRAVIDVAAGTLVTEAAVR